MRSSGLAQALAWRLRAGCAQRRVQAAHFGSLVMELNSLYPGFLSVMFVFWNSVRIFTYVPTIRKLLRPDASARDYSLGTWASWVLSNGFFALYLWEQSNHEVNSMVLLNAGNTVMCLITSCLIRKLQRTRGGASAAAR
jgi:hypothetical protein